MKVNTIVIGSDHAGFECKESVKSALRRFDSTINIEDVGTYNTDSVDYPDFAHQVAGKVAGNDNITGIVICGSGNGVCMAANKHAGIRAALCWTEEISKLARQHNDANVLCIPARFISNESAVAIVESFLNSEFEGGRHQKRVEKINC